ncbi:MAG: hypothetical protein EAY65_05270 [Alphaproteobacteria bacterium]|nr:MAG: hypothetical protein EAY65_05270 [Alphaproteobacteria bacterium]
MEKLDKKALARARVKRVQLIYRQVAQHHRATDLAVEAQQAFLAGLQEASREAEAHPDTVVWSAQTQMIRDKLTGKKRASTDRWNRFAGTSGGGGMGR